MTRAKEMGLRLLPFLVVIILWEGATRLGLIRPLFLPPLSVVLKQLWSMLTGGKILVAFTLTISRLLIGFMIAMVAGVSLGLVMALSKPLRVFFEPLIAAVYPLPKIAMLSLFIVWLGFGNKPIIAILAISSFFPIFISTVTGILTLENLLIQAARNLGASKAQLLLKVILPGALPVIFGGIRIASSLSFVVVVAVEMQIGDNGMGAILRRATEFYQMDVMYASLVAIGIFGVALFKVISLLERWLMPWHKSDPVMGR